MEAEKISKSEGGGWGVIEVRKKQNKVKKISEERQSVECGV